MANYLKEHGVNILQHNFQCRIGEIDLIGYEEEYLVFFEVKYRKNYASGGAAESVNKTKQRKICRVADYYRCRYCVKTEQAVRYDVVAVQGEEICWYRNAFLHYD